MDDSQINIRGSVSGQIVVGNYNVQINNNQGAVVNFVPPSQRPTVRARPTPIRLLPRPFAGFLDRESETEAAISALNAGQAVEIYGIEGIGKTSLLKHIAHELKTPDGVVFLSAKERSLDDLIQMLFDCFYECDIPFKPTVIQYRLYLKNTKAFVLLDDISLDLTEIETLMDIMPGCSFTFSSEERQLGKNNFSIALEGLPLDAGILLVEGQLGRRLTTEEYTAAKSLYITFKGHPLQLQQVTSLVREKNSSLIEIDQEISKDTANDSLYAQFLGKLTREEKKVLTLVASLGSPTGNSIENIAYQTNIPNPKAALKNLEKLGLVKGSEKGHENHYESTSTTNQVLQEPSDSAQWIESTISYYTDWVKKTRTPEEIVVETDGIIKSLEWGNNNRRWKHVLELVRKVHDAFLQERLFTALSRMLQFALEASEQMGDKASEAWVLERLGISAFALGEGFLGRAHLSRALQLLESIGDKPGAERIRENLKYLRLLKIFLCHSSSDKPKVVELYYRLQREGFDPWLDKENLLPGQDWQEEIPKAVKTSDVVLVCLSSNSVNKAGYVQKEIKFALDRADEQPDERIFIIPLKLEECDVPSRLRKWHWVNLFEEGGYEKLMRALNFRAQQRVEAG